MALGSGWAEKWQANQIAKERMKLQDQQFRAREAREERRLGLYGESVRATAELSRARAQAALRPKGGAAAKPNPANDPAIIGFTSDLRENAMRAGRTYIDAPGPPPTPAGNTTVINQTTEGSDPVPQAPPPEGTPIAYDRKGGMVRRMAGGGSIESGAEMSIEEAMSYGKRKSGDDAFTNSLINAASRYRAPEEKKPGAGDPGAARATRPVGSGPGGYYTTADLQPGGALSMDFAEGGVVPGQRDLTLAYDPEKTAMEMRRYMEEYQKSQQAQQAHTWQNQQMQMGDSANAATGSGGDSVGGISGTGGIGGSATGGAGGSAAAGTSGDDGSDGSGTYRRGGHVRKFQSGGRVMEAIDTGTSGPGSGFGYRAAPPARRY